MFKGIRWDMRLTDQRIVAFLARTSEPMSQEAIARALGCHENTVKNSIKRLRGIVTTEGSGNRVPYRYKVKLDELPDALKSEITSNR